MNDPSFATIPRLKQDLVDALSMMERAEVIDFNGHMSCRVPGRRQLMWPLKSITSARSIMRSASASCCLRTAIG